MSEFNGVDKPANVPLEIIQGANWSKTFRLKDENKVAFDLTGYTARMQIRRTLQSSDVIKELSTENGKIAILGSSGEITFLLTAQDTVLMTGNGVYDVDLIKDEKVYTIFGGKIIVIPHVTR
ncbi:MAG: hypothetical protein ABRQ38_07575 [Candidatus Eremiobacterota bacterium]